MRNWELVVSNYQYNDLFACSLLPIDYCQLSLPDENFNGVPG